jgi:hypothetical protein
LTYLPVGSHNQPQRICLYLFCFKLQAVEEHEAKRLSGDNFVMVRAGRQRMRGRRRGY